MLVVSGVERVIGVQVHREEIPIMKLQDAYARNTRGLRALAVRAERSRSGKANGQTAEYWRGKAEEYARLSQASDQELRDHLAAGQAAITARLAELRGRSRS